MAVSVRTEPPTGTIAMLFTDIEASTRLAARLGSAWPDVLRDHHRLVRTAIDDERGWIDGTEGDAFFATFNDPTSAVRAAVRAQRELQRHAWPEDVGELKVRMGLHVGYVERSDTGYVGLEVHRAARVAAAAHGGQLLLTGAARATINDTVPTESVGTHRLKDFPAPEALFTAVIDGHGAAAYPPPKAAEARPTNLPAGLPVLVGRDDELARIRQLVCEERERHVTITGRGGAGKSSLALNAAAALLDEHPGGVWIVRLATIPADADVLGVIAAAVGAEGEPGTAPLEAIAARLRDRGATLVVLDNLEHLTDGPPAVAQLLERLPDLRVIATSQVPLRLIDECVLRLDALEDDAAMALIARTVGRRTTAIIDDADHETLLEIVHMLDGLPLALELAAARLPLLSARQLRDRLATSTDLLKQDRSDRPERQRSLRATAEWSLGLLDESSRALFVRLGAFARPADIDTLETVLGEDGLDVLEAVATLLDVALLRRVESGDGHIRFGLPEALRQIAAAQLDASADGARWRRGHAAYVDAVIWPARNLMVTTTTFRRAVDALPEGSAALRWARSSADPIAGRIAAAMACVLSERGRIRELLELLEPFERDPPTDASVLATALFARGYSVLAFGEDRTALALAEHILALELDAETQVSGLILRGLARLFGGDPHGALPDSAAAVALSRDFDPATRSGVLMMDAQTRLNAGDITGAEEQLEAAIRVGAPVDAVFLRKRETIVADLAMLTGRLDEALRSYARSLESAQAEGNELQVMFDLAGASLALARAGHDAEALEVAGMAGAQSRELGGPGTIAHGHVLDIGDIDRIRRSAGRAKADEWERVGAEAPAALRVQRTCDLVTQAAGLAVSG